MIPFIPGLKLSELLYKTAVKQIMEEKFPSIRYSAARLDRGSDVLGFDSAQSMDHHWGPRLTIFLSEGDYKEYHVKIHKTMTEELPYDIEGVPTHFRDLHIDGGFMQPIDSGPVNHQVTFATVNQFFLESIGVNPTEALSPIDWLTIPQQRLRTIKSGKVFHDGLNQIMSIREKLEWYPHEIWLYLMANQWRRINQEEPFMGRCGDVGDELGSRVVAARLVKEIMQLCFLIEKEYRTYYKWFGTAFSRLNCAKDLTPIFHHIFDSQTWKERESHLSEAYVTVAKMHNNLGVTNPIEPEISNFHTRPYLIIHAERFVEELHDSIESESIKALPVNIGSIDQFTDSTDVLDETKVCRKLKRIYEENA